MEVDEKDEIFEQTINIMKQYNIPLIDKDEDKDFAEQMEDADHYNTYTLFFKNQRVFVKSLKIYVSYHSVEDIENFIKNLSKIIQTSNKKVVKLQGIWVQKEDLRFFSVYDHIKGRSLDKIKHESLDQLRKMNLGYEIAKILNNFHLNDCVFKNLKTANIMLDENNKFVCLTGYAKMKMPETMNTRHYSHDEWAYDVPSVIIKENVINVYTYTFQQDYWSLGVILEELFGGVFYKQNKKKRVTSSKQLMSIISISENIPKIISKLIQMLLSYVIKEDSSNKIMNAFQLILFNPILYAKCAKESKIYKLKNHVLGSIKKFL
jgi:serine/threonine protein kinase